MILFFDTETTGLVNFKLPYDAPTQPRLVQLAAILTDYAGKEFFSINTIIKNEDFEIPESASNVHGITNVIASGIGMRCHGALRFFNFLLSKASLLVGHNIAYDLAVLRGEFKRVELDFHDKPHYCTLQESINVCKLPGKYSSYKWPKLQEVYKHAFGKEFENAHDAMADIKATKDVYFWLKQFAQQEHDSDDSTRTN